MNCIYKIENKINGKFYIGSTNNFKTRKQAHTYKLEKNTHANKHLQQSWNKHGKYNFIFSIIEEFEDYEDRLEVEQEYLDDLQPFGERGYNIATDACNPFYLTDSCEVYKDRYCLECDAELTHFEIKNKFCSDECSDEYDNNNWRRSQHECMNISDWDVDDHLANYVDDRWEK